MFEKFKAQKAEKEANKKAQKKKVVMGALSALAFIFGLCFLPSLCSLLFALAGVLLLPIPKLQALWESVFHKAKFKNIACGALAVAAFATAPATTDTPPPVADDTTPPVIEQVEQEEDEETPPPSDPEVHSTFTIHFLDVGQGDAALVECDGRYMLIDGGESNDSSLIYSYLKEQGAEHLDYIVATHAHDDHIGGLSGALNYATADMAFCPVDSYDSEAFGDFVKYLGEQGLEITIPDIGDPYTLGSAEIQVVSVDSSAEIHNNSSIVLRIVYGDTAFLFAADAEKGKEMDIQLSDLDLKSTVLKVGHHGSDTSTSTSFLYAVDPQYAVISVGADNGNGHPSETTLKTLGNDGVTVYRTDLQGTIICESDGETITFTVEKNEDADTLAPPVKKEPVVVAPVAPPADTTPEDDSGSSSGGGTDYVGNKNSMKFHYSWCDSVKKMKESNKYYYTGTSEEMKAKGYESCANCNP